MNEMSRELIMQEEKIRNVSLEALDTGFIWKMEECIRNQVDEAHCNARWGNVSHIFTEFKSRVEYILRQYEIGGIPAEKVLYEIADAVAEAKNDQRDGLLLIEELFGVPKDATSIRLTEREIEEEYGTTDWKVINRSIYPKIYASAVNEGGDSIDLHGKQQREKSRTQALPLRRRRRQEMSTIIENENNPEHLFNKACTCFTQGKYEESMKLLVEAANNGHAESQYILGDRYSTGTGVPRNMSLAKEYLLKAIEGGNIEATKLMGYLIHDRQLLGTDKEAFDYYYQAAQSGDAVAMAVIGEFYQQGTGVQQSLQNAKIWYEKAIAADSTDIHSPFYFNKNDGREKSQVNLGNMYYYGDGVPQDQNKAFQLYREAARVECPIAERNLGVFYKERNNNSESFEWFKRAAQHGDVIGMTQTGLCYATGLGTEKNMDEAEKYFKMGAERGESNAQYLFGLWCDDETEKILWIKKSARQGNQRAAEWLRKHNA